MCNILDIVGSFAGGYLIGSIPFGYILVHSKTGNDIRNFGSGAIGATNVSRVLGKKVAVLVAIFDVLKGIIAFFIAQWLLKNTVASEIAVIGAVIGHCFPVWIGFRGGKGVSTAFGATLVLSTLPAVIAFVMFSISLVIVRKVSAASLSAIWVFSGLCFLLNEPIQIKILSLFLALFITFTHRKNITRLITGEEKIIFKKE
ncbi:glycerol-3-phosphate 1-O-acyltransferase PlsY [bacterium]|nr:glycerol-3-phosphate 1-O-acyltransferase PlsY [bacterium]